MSRQAQGAAQITGAVPRVSVVIASWNTKELLSACLDSLEGDARAGLAEVIVADNDSADGTPAHVRTGYPWVRLIETGGNLGYGRANNMGFAEARGPYLLVLNSDTVVKEGCLAAMCSFMDAHPDVGAVGPQLLNPDGTVQLSCRRFPSYSTALFNRYSLLTRLFPGNPISAGYLMTGEGHDEMRDVDWVSGAALMTRRSVLEAVGGFDDDYFMYAEDVDWCYRMHQANWRVVYLPTARIVHHIGRSTSSVPHRMTYERHRSMWTFYRKHYSRGIVLVDVATFLGIGARCALMIARNALRLALKREAQS